LPKGCAARWNTNSSRHYRSPGRGPDIGEQRERGDDERSTIGTREHEAEESYSPDESVIVVDSAGDHLITEMFPGATEVT